MRTEVMSIIHACIHALSYKAIRLCCPLSLSLLFTCFWRVRVTCIASDEDTIFYRELGGYTLPNWGDDQTSVQVVTVSHTY